MRRLPNPWIALPALVSGTVAAWLGGTVTAVTCRYRQPDGTIVTCPGWTVAISALSFVLVTAGITLVMVLVYRSLAEWREQSDTTRP